MIIGIVLALGLYLVFLTWLTLECRTCRDLEMPIAAFMGATLMSLATLLFFATHLQE